jgi:hypothetical protein
MPNTWPLQELEAMARARATNGILPQRVGSSSEGPIWDLDTINFLGMMGKNTPI